MFLVAMPHEYIQSLDTTVFYQWNRLMFKVIDNMNIINAIVGLVSDPRTAIAGWIASSPFMAFGLIFLVIFIEKGVVFMPFLPGDSLLFASGVFAATGDLSISVLLPVVWAAAVIGDQCNFFIGHFIGRRIIESGKIKSMTPERIKKSEAMLERYGSAAIFLGRFFPFIRTFVPFLAGCGGMRWHSFAIFNILGGVTWSSVFVGLGYFFGGIPFVSEHFELIVVGIVAISVVPALVAALKAKFGPVSSVQSSTSLVEE